MESRPDSDITRPRQTTDYPRPDGPPNPFDPATSLRSAPTDRPVTRSAALPSHKSIGNYSSPHISNLMTRPSTTCRRISHCVPAEVRCSWPLMTVLRAIIFSIALFVAFPGNSAAEDVQKSAEAMLERARQLSDIRSPNAPGFHLNLSFSFIRQDLETVQGTYTEVWVSNSQWRQETVVGNFRRIEIVRSTKRWLLDSGEEAIPEQAARVSTMVQVLPTKAAKFEFESFAEPDHVTRCAVTKPVGEIRQRHAFCFDKDNGILGRVIKLDICGEE